MRIVIGADEFASAVAVLVRLGVLPLEYMLALEAVLWVLRISRGESDPLLSEQWDSVRGDGTLESTCLYRMGCDFIDRLNGLIDEDLWESRPKVRRRLVRCSMFCDLDSFWRETREARVTHEIHPHWEERRLWTPMKLRF